jgi:hypothetical protein
MKKILIAGAGGPASEGVIKSLLSAETGFEVIGMGADIADLALSSAPIRYLVPRATDKNYYSELVKIIEKEKPDFIHAQNDREVLEISRLRDKLTNLGVRTFLPSQTTVENCVDKWKSFELFESAGLRVPRNLMIRKESDLQKAFTELANKEGFIWLRANVIGGGGIGALPTNDFAFAKKWIDHHNGWDNFLAAEILTSETVTWLSIWQDGNLIVAQSRSRGGWVHGNRTLSGVTGVTKIGQTISSEVVDDIARRAIIAIDKKPHGIFGVDMAYDHDGIPNPTEINIARFFTTVLFFTTAGLNLPEIFVNLCLTKNYKYGGAVVNPLPNGLLWFRGMDHEPVLMNALEFNEFISST